MRIGSLFSGAGGLDLAVEAVFGGRTVWHCEQDTAASKVLAHRWPVGWVTDPVIGISRNDQLRILGNGVVPQQAEVAIRQLLGVSEMYRRNQIAQETAND